MISVIVPAFNAQRTLGKALMSLTRAAIDGLVREVVVVDAGSTDATADIADDAGAQVVAGAGDRGAQLAAGAAAARSGWILTLSQDCLLLPGWEAVVNRHLETRGDKAAWFPLRAEGLIGRWLGAPRDGGGLLVPPALYAASGGFGPGRAEAALGARIGGGRRLKLDVPVLSPAASAGPGAR